MKSATPVAHVTSLIVAVLAGCTQSTETIPPGNDSGKDGQSAVDGGQPTPDAPAVRAGSVGEDCPTQCTGSPPADTKICPDGTEIPLRKCLIVDDQGTCGWQFPKCPAAGADVSGRDWPTSDGDAGGDGSGDLCGSHRDFHPQLHASVGGLRGGPPYAGPAVVERSVRDELMLVFTPDLRDATSGDADSGVSTPRRVTLTGLLPMPLIPRGTKVWLSKNRAGEQPKDVLMYGIEPWAISVQDRQAGHLLFGAFDNASDDAAAPPLRIGAVTPYCSAQDTDTCLPGMTVVYSSVEVEGDTRVTIRDSESASLAIAGIPYTVSATARNFTGTPTRHACADYHPGSGLALDIQAADVPSLVSGLELAEVPECSAGNDPRVELYFSLSGVNTGTTYEGPVHYTGRAVNPGDAFTFRVPGLLTSTGESSALYVYGAEKVFPEPAAGQTFWLSFGSRGQALLESEGGPLLLAELSSYTSDDTEGAAWLAGILGVGITAQERCASGLDSMKVWDVVFGTTPPVRLGSGWTATLQLASKAYTAWQWGEGAVSLSIYATP